MITIVNQVSSAWFVNKLLRKSLHNETNFNNIYREKTVYTPKSSGGKLNIQFIVQHYFCRHGSRETKWIHTPRINQERNVGFYIFKAYRRQ